MLVQKEVLKFLIEKGPGRTEQELAEAIFGKKAYQQQVNQDCRMLADRGEVDRRRDGGQADPFRYHPVNR
ncbi:hypothetical protein [Pseudophaeobacter sp. EL27]|uniref:hypothetical protein n=1 Tax=Pseudophaeobacter sp. EL27 TaxID=2107580 RepID=UPI0013C48B62|nr:hypothetical protein [Pseudophaeobacter sp. EL27]